MNESLTRLNEGIYEYCVACFSSVQISSVTPNCRRGTLRSSLVYFRLQLTICEMETPVQDAQNSYTLSTQACLPMSPSQHVTSLQRRRWRLGSEVRSAKDSRPAIRSVSAAPFGFRPTVSCSYPGLEARPLVSDPDLVILSIRYISTVCIKDIVAQTTNIS